MNDKVKVGTIILAFQFVGVKHYLRGINIDKRLSCICMLYVNREPWAIIKCKSKLLFLRCFRKKNTFFFLFRTYSRFWTFGSVLVLHGSGLNQSLFITYEILNRDKFVTPCKYYIHWLPLSMHQKACFLY